MKIARFPKSNSGFTIIEVLISSVVFMIGFSMLIALLNVTLAKFSTKELLAGTAVGKQVVYETLALSDSTSCDTIIQNSGLHFRVARQFSTRGDMVRIEVIVYRLKKAKEIVRFYDELALPKQ